VHGCSTTQYASCASGLLQHSLLLAANSAEYTLPSPGWLLSPGRGCAAAGHLQPQDVLGAMLRQLQQLEAAFQRQRRYQLYSCSVLVTYEGLAQAAAEARVRVRLVDFAHVFSSSADSAEVLRHEAVAAAGPAIDDNFLQGLRGLMRVLKSCVPELVLA
jgi:hypothetical protein